MGSFVFLVVVLSVLLYYIFKQKHNRRKKLPPGPLRWPILGSLPQMLLEGGDKPYLQLYGLAKKYGGLMSFGYGTTYAVVVSNFEYLKDVFRRPETNLERYRFDFLELRSGHKNLGIIFSYGDVWKEQRKYTLKLLRQFGYGVKHTMNELFAAEVNDLVRDIKQEVASSGGIWEVESYRLAACQINILWASVAGYRFDPHSPKIRKQFELNEDFFESLGHKNLLGVFPFLKIFPELSGYNHHYEVHRNTREFTKELIAEVQKQRGKRREPESFVEAYLDEIEQTKSDPNSYRTMEHLEITLMDLFLGGSDTTSVVSIWVILYLAIHQDVQKKAHAMIEKYLKTQGDKSAQIPSTALSSFPYLHAIVKEAMRHSPFQPMPAPRYVSADIECGGYLIPEGTCLIPNYYPVFHENAFWGDPENFRPERFLLPNGELDPTKVDRVFQFGLGTRKCPGKQLAMSSLFMIITGLLRAFSWEVVPGREPTMGNERPSLTIKPLPFPVRVTLRNNLLVN